MGKPALIFATNEEDAFKYITQLETEFEAAKNAYLTAKAEAEKKQKELARAEAWDTLLEGYIAAVDKTDRLASDVVAGFKKSKERAEDICANASMAVDAFQWMIDDMLKLARCVEEFKCEIDECVNQLSSAPQSDPLIAGLKKLQKATDDALKCLLDALKEWLNVLKSAELLSRLVGDKSGNSEGLDAILQALLDDFEKSTPHLNYADGDGCSPCKAPERPIYPLSQTPYYTATTKEHDELELCLDKTRTEYEKCSKAMAEAKACMDSLDLALKAARETNACKTK